MEGINIFEREEFGAVRVVDVNGEPWFVAKDVCECLELGNPRTSIALLDEDEKGVHTMDTPNDAVNTHFKKVNKFSYGDMPQGAEAFGKRHDHVLRDIEQILTQVPEIFIKPNFGVSEYTDSTGRSLDGVESDIDN